MKKPDSSTIGDSKLSCGHTGENWDGEGNCISCARDKINNSQVKLIDELSDPETMKRAVEGSMKKRNALIDRVNDQPKHKQQR